MTEYSYQHFQLLHVVFVGAGMGILDGFILGHINRCFVVYRSMANAISFSGSKVGALVLPMYYYWAVTNSGYKDSMLFISGILIHITVVCAVMWPVSIPQSSIQSDEMKEDVFSIKLLNFKSTSDLQNSQTRGNSLGNTNNNDSVKRPGTYVVNTEIDHVNHVNDNSNCNRIRSDVFNANIAVEQSHSDKQTPIFTNIPLLLDMLALCLGCFPFFGLPQLWPVYLQEQKKQDLLGPLSITVAAGAELIVCPLLGIYIST